MTATQKNIVSLVNEMAFAGKDYMNCRIESVNFAVWMLVSHCEMPK